MKQFTLLAGALYGALSVVLGAFGAHALKKVLDTNALASFETGVKYQMYHALVLLVIGYFFTFTTKIEYAAAWCFIAGTFLFSGSIYLLSMQSAWQANLKFLGPVTPLGGLLMIVGWVLLAVVAFRVAR